MNMALASSASRLHVTALKASRSTSIVFFSIWIILSFLCGLAQAQLDQARPLPTRCGKTPVQIQWASDTIASSEGACFDLKGHVVLHKDIAHLYKVKVLRIVLYPESTLSLALNGPDPKSMKLALSLVPPVLYGKQIFYPDHTNYSPDQWIIIFRNDVLAKFVLAYAMGSENNPSDTEETRNNRKKT